MTKQELHTKISYLKSVVRMLGYLLLVINLELAVVILIISEIIGIAEEIIYE